MALAKRSVKELSAMLERWLESRESKRAEEAANGRGKAVLKEIFRRGPRASAAVSAVMAVMVHERFRRHAAVDLAKQALESIGAAAVPALVGEVKLRGAVLESRSDEAAENAAVVLGFIQPITVEAVQVLKSAAEDSSLHGSDLGIRPNAVHALWKMYPALLEFFPDFRRWVVERLGMESYDYAKNMLSIVAARIDLEGELLERAVDQLAAWLNDTGRGVPENAARALGRLGEAGVNVLRGFKAEDHDLRVAIRRAIVAYERGHIGRL